MKYKHWKFRINRKNKQWRRQYKKIAAGRKIKRPFKFNVYTKYPTTVYTISSRRICEKIGLDDLPF